MFGLTKKQKKLLSYIEECINEKDQSPSFQEMMEHMGYKSKSSIYVIVEGLEERGAIYRLKHRSRSIMLTSKTQVSDNGNPSDFQSENAGSIPATCSNALEALDALDELDVTLSAIAADLIFGMEGMSVNWASEMRDNEYKSHISTIKQALTQQGWRPIETAPKDGTRFLISDGECVGYVYFNHDRLFACISNEIISHHDSTHWQPLPEPPTQGDSE